jgi:hypothetical protein
MQESLSQAYEEIAESTAVVIAPVGSAWLAALKHNPNLPLWHFDGKHPSPTGSYLAACVFYAYFFQENPRELVTSGTGVNEETAFLLGEIAHETVTP